MEQSAIVESIIQVATTGGFGALLWYVIVKQLPKLQDIHRQERSEWSQQMKQQGEEFTAAIEKRDQKLADLVDRYHKQNLDIHDALAGVCKSNHGHRTDRTGNDG